MIMNESQRLIAELLAAAIGKRDIQELKCSNTDWEEIYNEAKSHGVHTLLYPVIRDNYAVLAVSSEIMHKWSKAALTQGIFQLQLMKEVQNVLMSFHEAGIRAIALKGIILRELYPYPELRAMGDADILTAGEDIDKAAGILTGLGFRRGESNPEHMEFMKNNVDIELHWSLIGDERFRNCVKLEDTVWENAVETVVFGAPALMLSKEDNFLYTGLHMAKHIVEAGFGLRQLCDFTLLYESFRGDIAWNTFFSRVENYGMEKFFTILLLAGRKLFGIGLPDCDRLRDIGGVDGSKKKRHGKREQIDCSYEKYALLLIEEIFEGGLYGYRSRTHTLGSFAVRKVKCEKSSGMNCIDSKKATKGKYSYLRQLVLPPARQLGDRYGYAVKYPVLLPAAYIHRIINYIFRKELSLKDKLTFTKQYGKRSDLLGWLNIR